ncbi:FliO/MopB family protein [Microbacterium sp. NPDC056234]|uniref:FliO/MopB family protein n=1 Tax=Microbacterium sp. NPDC056234 TaxID=3345757 RepID=UPI0035D8E7C8
MLRVAVSLAAVLGLLWFLHRRISRSTNRTREPQAITVLGRQGVGAKAQVVIVRTEDARYVLGVTEHGVSVIDKLTPDAAAPTADEFDRLLASALADDARGRRTDAVTTASDLPVAEDAAAPPATRLRVRHRNDPLNGSILSPSTWRQTAEALRRVR